MLARDVRVEDFDAKDWLAVCEIFRARAASAPRGPDGGVLLVVVDGGRALKFVSTAKGRLDPSGAETGSLAALAEKWGASAAIRVSRTALLELSDRLARVVERSDDYFDQIEKLRSVAAELVRDGQLEVHPEPQWLFGQPTARTLGRVFDALCPPGKTLLFGAFSGGEVETAIALHRGANGFDRIVGPDRMRHELGLRSGDWARDAKQLVRAAELSVGSVSLGVFAETRTFKELVAESTPGVWTAAIVARDVLLHPVLPAVAIPLGVDVGRAAFAAAQKLATRFGVSDWVSQEGGLRAVLERARDRAGRSDVFRSLGFDPISLLLELLDGQHPRN